MSRDLELEGNQAVCYIKEMACPGSQSLWVNHRIKVIVGSGNVKVVLALELARDS